MSLKEINDHYQYSSLYDGEIIPPTFARYKDYIAETFPCYIDYNQSTNQYFLKRYHQYGQDDSLYNYLLSVWAHFARSNTQQLLKTPAKSSLLHKIGCGSEKQLNKFIDFSLALHNFSPPNSCTTQIKVLPLQQQNSFASRKNCRRVIFYYKL